MKKYLLFILISISSTLALAQDAAPRDQLYKALGEKAGLVKLMDDFLPRLQADPRTGPFFKEVDEANLKKQLVDQFCEVSGGPCVYKGQDMKTSHMDLKINRAHFNALVEILQVSMAAQGTPFSAQNKLLAELAGMHRAIITTETR
ncbi:group I truncated hemoglobin [Massilia glaciei]|uniref:Group 1 truncated hemoglobin n=1 Tax=Massilia glaciei TaxID=1524097 RepID=A0A2U2HEC1_9BURK|nr:group 1 truncated hemoglobin [Massilia glaciei]PWF41777.1 group 1 truncated hemoglobin [Massilia glaciei]